MTWFKVDDKLWGHPKWLGLPPTARALWVTAGSWCAANETDGRLILGRNRAGVRQASVTLSSLGGRKRDAEALVSVGLWEAVDGGYQFHDWEHYQPTKAQVRAEREATRERQRRWRESRMSRRDNPSRNAVTNALRNGVTNAAPSRPDPTSSSPHLSAVTAPPNKHATEEEELSNNQRLAMGILGCAPDDKRLRLVDDLIAAHRPISRRGWLTTVVSNGDFDGLIERIEHPDNPDPWAHIPEADPNDWSDLDD